LQTPYFHFSETRVSRNTIWETLPYGESWKGTKMPWVRRKELAAHGYVQGHMNLLHRTGSALTDAWICFLYGARRFLAVFTIGALCQLNPIHALTSNFSSNIIPPYTNRWNKQREDLWLHGKMIPVLVFQTHVSRLEFDNHHRTWLNARIILHIHTPRRKKKSSIIPWYGGWPKSKHRVTYAAFVNG
jgi:hypothetical protein